MERAGVGSEAPPLAKGRRGPLRPKKALPHYVGKIVEKCGMVWEVPA
jgi:hypothetical protein